ncbi:MAG: mechanosensitive ion channel [Burkholderiales bacterium]|nr:mechanosensitive ion channel [Burkholderiales bacterium]
MLRDQAIAWGPRILAAIVILLLAHFLARGVKWAIARAVDRVPALQRQSTARPGETLGGQIGALGYWLVWLVGLIVALQPLGLSQALTPIRTLTEEVFTYLPRVIGAGVVFFVGLLIARVVRNIVETALAAANADGWLRKAGVGKVTNAADAVPAEGARMAVSRTVGMIVFALIIIPVSIAALQVLGISSISEPAVAVLQTVLNAIPRVLAAAIVLAIAWFVGSWVRGLVEQILPSLGFDRALTGIGGFTTTTQPSRVVGAIVLTAIMLFSAIEATRLLDFDAVSAMLVQVTDLGGRVIFGSAIIAIGVLMARIVTKLVGESVGESGLPSILKYAIVALAVAIGLRFMGLANEIVNLAFGLILGSAAVAVALAFGLGGRTTAHQLLQRWTGKGSVDIESAGSAVDPQDSTRP